MEISLMDSISLSLNCDASIGRLRALDAPGIGHRVALGSLQCANPHWTKCAIGLWSICKTKDSKRFLGQD
jgi:hypothetical protein